MYDRDLKTFTESHDHAPPEMLPFILARKRDIAKNITGHAISKILVYFMV
ncbi:hypothetical protein HanPI659440_Chr04g0154991 [Helianthus annuus]|nr:hypothetical protein HanPI659440_Chr04g0154991 [Helianthus annuus]